VERIVVEKGVIGVSSHDARLAATMVAHRISRILTLNVADFRRYADLGVVAVTPAESVAP
jgi:predicted nucleic acid-binding protein